MVGGGVMLRDPPPTWAAHRQQLWAPVPSQSGPSAALAGGHRAGITPTGVRGPSHEFGVQGWVLVAPWGAPLAVG